MQNESERSLGGNSSSSREAQVSESIGFQWYLSPFLSLFLSIFSFIRINFLSYRITHTIPKRSHLFIFCITDLLSLMSLHSLGGDKTNTQKYPNINRQTSLNHSYYTNSLCMIFSLIL